MSAGADGCERSIMQPVTAIALYYVRENSIGSSSLGARYGSHFLKYSDCRNELPIDGQEHNRTKAKKSL
jgi:hypothetical protein